MPFSEDKDKYFQVANMETVVTIVRRLHQNSAITIGIPVATHVEVISENKTVDCNYTLKTITFKELI